MFNPTFKENVQGRKHPWNCAFAETELLSYKKPKRVVQNEKNGHKNPNNSHNYHDENYDETIKAGHNDTQHDTIQSGRSPKVVALFSATNFSSNIIELLQLHDTIQI